MLYYIIRRKIIQEKINNNNYLGYIIRKQVYAPGNAYKLPSQPSVGYGYYGYDLGPHNKAATPDNMMSNAVGLYEIGYTYSSGGYEDTYSKMEKLSGYYNFRYTVKKRAFGFGHYIAEAGIVIPAGTVYSLTSSSYQDIIPMDLNLIFFLDTY